MPTYAYACKDCGHEFDVHQSFSDDSLTTCPECGGTLRKKFNTVGVVFKGSGFYRTDSRKSADAPSSAGTQTSGAGSKAAGSGSSGSASSGSGSSGSGATTSSGSGKSESKKASTSAS